MQSAIWSLLLRKQGKMALVMQFPNTERYYWPQEKEKMLTFYEVHKGLFQNSKRKENEGKRKSKSNT